MIIGEKIYELGYMSVLGGKKWCISLIELIIVELLKMIFFIKMGDCVYKYDWGMNMVVFYIM